TVLVVMDPKVSTSAEAYTGLRKQIAMAASSRQAHLVQLAQFSRALRRGAGSDQLSSLVEEWMQQAGLAAVVDPNPDLYEILEGDSGSGHLEITAPAYLDPQSGVLVAQGQARWVPEANEVSTIADADGAGKTETIANGDEPNDAPEEAIA
ncbi:MAG: hypothetical protein ABI595_15350, partial [Actinomycetota bacterium]